MEQSEDTNHEENLEERHGHVGLAGDQQGEGQEGGESPVENSRGDIFHDVKHPALLSAVSGEETVDNVGTEVHTEPHADDEDVHAGHVDGEAPPVHEAGHVSAGEEDAHHDQQGASPAAQRDQGGDEDAH